MAREINLFEQETETVEAPAKKEYYQASLPGILEKIQIAQEQKINESKARLKAKRIIEALLFSSNEPIPFNKLREILEGIHDFKPRVLRDMIDELQGDYITQNRAYRLEEIAQGFLLRTCEEFGPYINLLYRNKRTEKLSHAAAEVLAIIAYRQPITRPQIDAIRGVDSSGVVQVLLERQLIEQTGRLEAPGRPTLYGITKDFLKHFGLKDLNELPRT